MNIKCNEPLVSIIIPIYNAEQYLVRCLESLLAQVYQNIEILLVDDGSQDHSGNICDDYLLKDNRIRVLHLENGGVSRARNKALEIMKGDWVCFVDSDDEVTPFYVQHFVDAIEEGVDVIISEALFVHEDGSSEVLSYKSHGILSLSEIFADNELSAHGYACAKCYRTWHMHSATHGLTLRFPEDIKFSEDLIFVMQYLSVSPKAKYISYADYIYYLHGNSASSKVFPFYAERNCLIRYIELVECLSILTGKELIRLSSVGSILTMLFARVRNSMYMLNELSRCERLSFYRSLSISIYRTILMHSATSNSLVRLGYKLFMRRQHWQWMDLYFYLTIGVINKWLKCK